MCIFRTVPVVLALSACSTIDYARRVEGWPELTTEVHRVTSAEVRDACSKYSAAFSSAMACSEFLMAEKVCRVWLPNDLPGDTAFLEDHERAHCRGFDHPGSDAMQRMLDEWKKGNSHGR